MKTADLKARDALYQSPSHANPSVYVIGIDEQTLSSYGNKIENWGREKLAGMIRLLNSDPDTAPAVIGVDICIFGNPEDDPTGYTDELIDAVREAGNVILVNQAMAGISVEENDGEGTFTVGKTIQSFEEPCPELKAAALDIGHCNLFMDEDDVARHGLGSLEYKGEKHSSLAYRMFSHFTGREDARFDQIGDRFLIDYSGKPGDYYGTSFAGSSFKEVLEGSFPKEAFAGSAVFIGAFAMGMRDNYRASIGGQMHGVEIHANMLAQMLEGRYKAELPDWTVVLFTIAIFAATVFFIDRKDHRKGLLGAILTTAVYVIICKLLYTFAGISLPVVSPVLTSIIVIAANILMRFGNSLIERRIVIDRFSRYMAPEVARRISDTSIAEAWPTKEADIAVMYVDIHSFTTLSEKLGTEIVDMLQHFFDVVLESAYKFEGTCDKMIGDCAMILFGVPLDVEDYEYKAVCAALDIKEKIENNAVTVDTGNGPEPVTVGIGIDCGPVMCGEMGSKKYRVEYTAIGDTVNTASRIEGECQSGTNEILIGERLYECIKDRFVCESRGSIQLRGKAKETNLYQIVKRV